MSATPTIHYLKNQEIDRVRWDACIDNADNGLIYAYSFFLDTICDHWDALVLDNYKVVMPLPWRSKWGIKYVYQAPFIQRLGLFGNISDESLHRQFYLEASRYFRFIYYNTSTSGYIQNTAWQELRKRENLIINLKENYHTIRNGYSNECIKNLLKAEKRGCTYTSEIAIAEVVALYKKAYGMYQQNDAGDYYIRLNSLISAAVALNRAELRGIKDSTGETIFGAAIFKDAKRIYYVLGAPTQSGREKRATYFFIDALLKENAGTPKLFDFEGSDIPNVANFYHRFGPQIEYYYEMKMNKLPRAIKWLKT